MKLHKLMAGAAVLAFATGAIAQDAASPATPDPAANGAAAAAATSPDAGATVAAPDAAALPSTATNGDNNATAATAPATDAATAATAPATDAATAATAPATDAATAATAPATDAATAATAPATDAATAATAPDAAAPQTAMTAPAPDPAKAQAADQMIAQNWSKYDANNKGQLTPLEFGNWIMAAQGNDMTAQVEKSRSSKAANLPSTKVLNATAAEFSKADTNKDHQVSQEELKVYLSA